MRAQVRRELGAIAPHDALEQAHLADALAWVDSGAELFRLKKPATPPKHLVSYFAVLDGEHILLVNHKSAQLWLPAGGHVEPQEHPRHTVVRELLEELSLVVPHAIGAPAMVSCTSTVGSTAGHTDVSLWYVVHADRHQPMAYDSAEFNSVCGFPFNDVPLERPDPHLGRFLAKLGSNPSLQPTSYGWLRQPSPAAELKR